MLKDKIFLTQEEYNSKSISDTINFKCDYCKEIKSKKNEYLRRSINNNKTGNIFCSTRCSINSQKLTNEEFFEVVNLKHNNTKNRFYIYPSVIKTSKEHINVICSIHGNFPITPNNHMRGYRLS